MKKIFFALTLIVASFTIISCSDSKDDDKRIDYDQLPTLARDFIKENFADLESQIKYVEHDKDGTYDVVFRNNVEIEFYSNGDWKDIDLNGYVLPESVALLIPSKALSYVSTTYPGVGIDEIEKIGNQSATQDFEVDLINDVADILFDYLGNVKRDKQNTDGGNQIVPIDQLPEASKTFLKKYFEGQTPHKIEKEWDKFEIEYKNGVNEVEVDFFNSQTNMGEFKSVGIDGSDEIVRTIMKDMLPSALDYVNQNYGSYKIEEFSKTPSYFTGELAGGYKVEVEQGKTDLDLYFNKNGEFIKSARD